MQQESTYWILDRESLSQIEWLDEVVDELNALLESPEFVQANTKNKVVDLIRDFLDFVWDESQELLGIRCWVLSKLRKSWKISHRNGGLRKAISDGKREFIRNNWLVIDQITPEDFSNIVEEYRDEYDLVGLISADIVTVEEIHPDSLTIILKSALKNKSITFSQVSLAISKTTILREEHAELFMEIANDDIHCLFDDFISHLVNVTILNPNIVYLTSQIAVEDESCGDVSDRILRLADKHW